MKRFALVAIALGFLVAADAAKEDANKSDMKAMQGTWVAASGEENGEKFPDDVAKSMKLTVKGEDWTFQRGCEMLKGTLKIDATKKPKTFDATVEGSGDAVLGIYELTGDTNKFCWSAPGGDRPTDFSAKADSGRTNILLKREK